MSAALRLFNEDKTPELSEKNFRECLLSYAENRNQHDLEFNTDMDRFKLKMPF
ncbi:hypothetical protein ACFQT0_19595 [Hymenobacter humi]|uniref:Uncharacterized protein n=1 Tax=Hymenobacter humi TaxID=1411620 RepID=A0ABW2UAB9_9BACT